jgi:hypothetical protein
MKEIGVKEASQEGRSAYDPKGLFILAKEFYNQIQMGAGI